MKNLVHILLAVLVVGIPTILQSAEQYRYTEMTGDKTTHFDLSISGSDPITVTSIETGKRFRNLMRKDGSQVEWEYKGDDGWIKVTRDGDLLRFKARMGEKDISKTEDLDGIPWFQALSFSLRQWLQSGRDTVRFWMVRPDDLEMHKMKAEREDVEMVKVDGREIEAQRVKVKLAGAFSLFWSVTYWFRTSDYLLVRYEGVHGPPGTPKTVITLNN